VATGDFERTFGPVMDYYQAHSGDGREIRIYGIGPVTYDPPVAFIWVGPGVEVPSEIGGITILTECIDDDA
jgi:hypothetical protein